MKKAFVLLPFLFCLPLFAQQKSQDPYPTIPHAGSIRDGETLISLTLLNGVFRSALSSVSIASTALKVGNDDSSPIIGSSRSGNGRAEKSATLCLLPSYGVASGGTDISTGFRE